MKGYHVTTTVDCVVVGEFRAPIPDPFVRTTLTIGPRRLLRALLRWKPIVAEFNVGADSDTVTRVLELDPEYLGPKGSASRTAWDAQLATALRTHVGEESPPKADGPVFMWKGKRLTTVYDIGGALAALTNATEAAEFMAAYSALTPAAAQNVGYIAGQYGDAVCDRILRLTGTTHTSILTEAQREAGRRMGTL